MYWCWEEKGILPSTFNNLPIGEKIILRAFMEKTIDLRNQPQET